MTTDYMFSITLRNYQEGNGLGVRKLGKGRLALDFGTRALVLEFMVLNNKG